MYSSIHLALHDDDLLILKVLLYGSLSYDTVFKVLGDGDIVQWLRA